MRRFTTRSLLGGLVLLSGATAAGAAPSSLAPAKHAPASENPSPGSSTLDHELQRGAERLLRQARPVEGGVVMLEPKTGRVLAFAALGSGGSLRTLTRARMPAASVFKLVTTTALLERTDVSLRDRVCINGGMHGIERRHLEPAHGPGTECGRFAWALGHSKNAVFAQLATRKLTRTDLVETAQQLGFNTELELDDGRVHAELGKLQVPYNDLAFARTAAGFQGSSLSPLGAAYLMTLVARGGEPVELRLHEQTNDQPPEQAMPAGDAAAEHDEPEPEPKAPAPFSAKTARLLTRMLEVTVETGTSRSAFTAPDGKRYLPGIRVAGKTGTLRPHDSEDKMTSWFTGFAPSRNPQVVVSVMLVNGPTYRRKANEVARDMLRMYFHAHGYAGSVSDPFEEQALAQAKHE